MCSEPSSTEKQDNNTSIWLQYGHLLKSIACFVLIQINCNFLLSIYNNGTCIYNHKLFLLEIKGLTNKISFEYKSYMLPIQITLSDIFGELVLKSNFHDQ